MTSLPPALLEQLLAELSTLASVYHKPPESFVGKGRFGADEIQRAAIQEQRQNAADNPIAASVAAATAAANGSSGAQQHNNAENLLDIDFDGAAPASQENNSSANPSRTASPAGPSGGMADMMSMFDAPPPQPTGGTPAPQQNMGGMNDLMGGLEGLNFGSQQQSQPLPAGMQLHGDPGGFAQPAAPAAPAGQQGQKKDSDDLLGLF